MSTTPAGFDFDALAEWAESDEATHTPQTSPCLLYTLTLPTILLV